MTLSYGYTKIHNFDAIIQFSIRNYSASLSFTCIDYTRLLPAFSLTLTTISLRIQQLKTDGIACWLHAFMAHWYFCSQTKVGRKKDRDTVPPSTVKGYLNQLFDFFHKVLILSCIAKHKDGCCGCCMHSLLWYGRPYSLNP